MGGGLQRGRQLVRAGWSSLPRVKVCGLTRVCDAHWARRVRADALGVVYAPGKGRHVEPHQIKSIFARTFAPWRVLVVVNGQARDLRARMLQVGANALQLCGDQVPGDWAGFPFPVLRRVGVDGAGAQKMRRWQGVARAFVLDHPAHVGGAGLAVDHALAASLARVGPCILAGGLHAGNVADAIAKVRPRGVDASSKLERCLREKHSAKVRAYVTRAKDAFETVRV